MTSPQASQINRQPLATPLDQVSGIGPRIREKLARMGLFRVEDLLFSLPYRYEDRRQLRRIAHLREGAREVFAGEVLAAGENITPRARKRLFEVVVSDGSGQAVLKWFHYRRPWMKERFIVGRRGIFVGEIRRFGGIREVHHPDVEFLAPGQSWTDLETDEGLGFGRILPVYSLTEGLHQKTAQKIWRQAVEKFAPLAKSTIPEDILHRRNLLPLSRALELIHLPPQNADLHRLEQGNDAGRRSVVFDEFFFLELGLALKRRGFLLEKGIPFQVRHRFTKPLAAMLPFRLTEAQRRVLGEIKEDLMAPHPMNRLVQGDVGSGKTIVALMAALVAIENNTQVAVIAPTEILAEQHYLNFRQWMTPLGLKVALLSGALSAKEKGAALEKISSGEVALVVGTHAVLQEGVEFHRLGLGIIDEQHRFGVIQRSVLKKKGDNPHILVMTATPIPRTLALTIYGDLSLSVIDQMPPGRKPVATRVLRENDKSLAFKLVGRELEQGHQAYIVFPLVEESEKSDLKAAVEGADFLRNEVFPSRRIGLVHGRMKPEEKDAAMTAFKNRELDILVATTVIEVGIDVPNATVMMVEHAERFGLAQLHQLRGRVGRGEEGGLCLLVRGGHCSEDAMRRLAVMTETSDGFRIAEADLEIRGPGDVLGTRQAGLPDLRVANILRDARILEEARKEAFHLAAEPDFLTSQRYIKVRHTLLERWGTRLELAGIG